MSDDKLIAMPNIVTPNEPVVFNPDICNGCNHCVEVCQIDVYIPHPEKGKPPIILYPDECAYDGLCVKHCPLWLEGAIKLNTPLIQRLRWKRKATGEYFRIGMADPPPPYDKPPVGGWDPKP